MARKRQIQIFSAGCPVCQEVVDGKLADCCAGRGPDEAALRAAGLGQTI